MTMASKSCNAPSSSEERSRDLPEILVDRLVVIDDQDAGAIIDDAVSFAHAGMRPYLAGESFPGDSSRTTGTV